MEIKLIVQQFKKNLFAMIQIKYLQRKNMNLYKHLYPIGLSLWPRLQLDGNT